MKQISSCLLVLVVAGQLSTFSAYAEQGQTFKPLQLGAPATRTGKGTRAVTIDEPELSTAIAVKQIQLLATQRTGLSSTATPILHWYTVSALSPYTIEITVQQDGNTPILKKNIGVLKTAGLQTIRLADYGVQLANGQDYTWSVALIADAKQAPIELTSAVIRYQIPNIALTDVTKMTETGYWYDAVTQLVTTKSSQLQQLLSQEGIFINQ